MRPFTYRSTQSAQAAVALGAGQAGTRAGAPAQFLAGGTTLIDLMKIDVMRPQTLIDIKSIADPSMHRIDSNGQELRIGALVSMAEAADNAAIKRDYPVLSQSLWMAASQQLRIMARLGGNVLQRTRCTYFRDTSYACNKRDPGTGCAAMDGVNRLHAVLGTSENCIAAYPGDWAQGLIALDAKVEVLGPKGTRTIAFSDLHREPGNTPHIETNLQPGDLITAFIVPAGPHTRRSLYLKVRDRESYEFALASAAVALELEDGAARSVRIALGGVSTRPWRAHEAEAALVGKPVTEPTAWAAAEIAFDGAVTHGWNDFKPELGRRTLVRALLQAAQMDVA